MRALFVVIPEKGHVNPYVGPAQWLRKSGNDIAFYAPADLSAHFAGLGFQQILPEGMTVNPPSHANRGAEFAARVKDHMWLRQWIKTLLVDLVPSQVPCLRRIVREYSPDVIVADPMVYQAPIVAQLERVPWVALSSSLNPLLSDDLPLDSELLSTVRWLAGDRDDLFLSFGAHARFRGCDCLSPWLTAAFTTAEFVGNLVADVELVGPSIPLANRGDEPDFPWHKLQEGVPLIYMSFGSQVYYQPRMFKTVIDAVTDKSVQLLVSAGELAHSPLFVDAPGNVLALPYVPQLAVLEHAKVFITHGGANSVMESLHAAVPMLISPICNDQAHQAYFIDKAGVGISCNIEKIDSQACWQLLTELLSSASIHGRVNAVAASYRRQNGAQTVAHLIEDLVASRICSAR